MAQEVGSPIVQLVLAACLHAGVDVDGLCSGLRFRREDLSDPAARVDWEDFTSLLDRVLDAAGSPEAMEAWIAEGPRLMLSGALNLDVFPDLRALFVWMLSSATGLLHCNLQTSTKLSGSGSILCEFHIPPPFRPCRALAIASLGLFKGVPRVFGLPDALVSCTFDDRSGLFLVELPPSPLGGLHQVQASGPGASEPVRRAGKYLTSAVEGAPWLVESGQEMLRVASLPELGQWIEKGFRIHGGCASGRFWVRSEAGDMTLAHAWGPGFVSTRPRMLTMGARILGRLELSGPDVMEQRVHLEFLAWACVALGRLLDARPLTTVKEVQPAFVQRLELTPRQRQVLFLLVQGLSDKEIAHTIGTSPKTVGHQVGALLKKGGVASRTALANRCLSV